MDRNLHLKILALVGARSGSRGVPDKNIKELGGKPLMAWIIEAARNSQYVNRVIVSTDSEKYAAIARRYGAEVPFLRPKEIAGDHSTDLEYIIHALGWLEKNEGYAPDIVLRLVPTTPFQTSGDIDQCIGLLIEDTDTHSSLVVAEARQHPHKAMKIIDDGGGGARLVTYITESSRDVTPGLRQNYAKAYFRANVIACWTRVIKDFNSLTGERVKYHVIPQARAIDIDAPIDFFIAEKLWERWKENPNEFFS